MFSLTRQEQVLIVCVLMSIVIGSIVKHYRHAWRAEPVRQTFSPTPAPSESPEDR